jgi:hypothetical protein
MNIEVTSSTDMIRTVGNGITDLLLYKHEQYGQSALDPLNIFPQEDPVSSIFSRLNDKLARIKHSGANLRFNDVADLMGYLNLLCCAKGWTDFTQFKD